VFLFQLAAITEGFVEWPHFKTAMANGLFLSSSGKLNLAFSLGGDAVAGRWTELPASNHAQNVAISNRPCALQDQRAIDVPVSADDEVNLDPAPLTWSQKRIGCHESLG
jgi:hypothetical protein